MHWFFFIIYAVGIIISLAIPFFVEAPGDMISSASLVIGIISLWLTHVTLITARSIRNYKRINTSITALATFLEEQIIPERTKAKNDRMEECERLSLRNQIANTLCCCKHIDSEAEKIFKQLMIQLESKKCHYKDVIQSMKLAIRHANDNNN